MTKNHAGVLFGDFNCPFCYALHEGLHEMDLLDRCLWRGAQHAPHLPKPMKSWEGTLGADLRHEVAVVRRLAPGLPISLPPGNPNTRAAMALAASKIQQDRRSGMNVVRDLYRAFWWEGKDISNPLVLDEFGISDGADIEPLLEEWNEGWHATGHAGVPLIVSPDGHLLVGCVPVEELRRFFS